jgi:hypothetical protein
VCALREGATAQDSCLKTRSLVIGVLVVIPGLDGPVTADAFDGKPIVRRRDDFPQYTISIENVFNEEQWGEEKPRGAR